MIKPVPLGLISNALGHALYSEYIHQSIIMCTILSVSNFQYSFFLTKVKKCSNKT